jgi:hypothetical protein
MPLVLTWAGTLAELQAVGFTHIAAVISAVAVAAVCAACRDPLDLVLDPNELPAVASEVLACCQSLVQVDGELIGDPLEKAALQVSCCH